MGNIFRPPSLQFPATAGPRPALLGTGVTAYPLGFWMPRLDIPRPGTASSITVKARGGWLSTSADIDVVEDPAVRTAQGQVTITAKTETVQFRILEVIRDGFNHFVVAVLRNPAQGRFDTCAIFHHPGAFQHEGGVSDKNYDPVDKHWGEIMLTYTFLVGGQHVAASSMPLLIPLIRVSAWVGANAHNYVFGDRALETLQAIMAVVAGSTNPPIMKAITTASYSNGIQSQGQTIARLPASLVTRALDYDSSITRATKNIAPTASCRVIRYSQSAGAHPASREFYLPYPAWPAAGWRNTTKPPPSPPDVAMQWVHRRIVNTCHYHAIG